MNRSAKVVELVIGDQFLFDDQVLTVAEPPQLNWGLVEVWVEEWDYPFEASVSSRVQVS